MSAPRDRFVRYSLILMGLVTATPALALIDVYALEWTYQVTDADPMVVALLRHRGMLQLALGAALVWAALRPETRVAAACAAIATKGTFLALILPDDALRSDLSVFSVVVDLTCVAALAAVIAFESRRARRGERQAVA